MNLPRKFKAINMRDKYISVFNGPDGEEVLQHICKTAYVTTPTLAKTHDETMMNEGMRRLALSILRMVKKSESGMLEEIMKEYDS